MIPHTRLDVSGSRFRATYALAGEPADAHARAGVIAVEQTIEFPAELVGDDDIRHHVIGRVERFEVVAPGRCEADISYAVETSGGELPQLMNVLFGNCSMIPGVRLVAVSLPDDLLSGFRGPRFGVAGLRALLDAPRRPLVATALKPMGLGSQALARMAATLAQAGLDIIKDDHGIANQPFAPYRERVRRCAEAVAEANARHDRRALYMPSVTGPADRMLERAHLAREAGAGALLVIPGLAGLDGMRVLADDGSLGLPIMAHPAFWGTYAMSDDHGIEHGILYGTFARLGGADLTIFPGYGGRFSYSREACASIVAACRSPLGSLRPAVPAPGGGMTLERVNELLAFYGTDSALLIGGDLHHDDLLEGARRFRQAVDDWSTRPPATPERAATPEPSAASARGAATPAAPDSGMGAARRSGGP